MLWLQLRNELWKLFGKKRTYMGFLMFLLAQNVVSLIFRLPKVSKSLTTPLENNGYQPEFFVSSLTIATAMLIPIVYFMLPLYVSLVGGDLVAKEAEDGTLRMILSRPISRIRLLLVKWLAGTVFSVALVLSLGVFGLLFSSLWFSWGGLFVFVPGEIFSVYEPADGLKHYAIAHMLMTVKAVTVMTLAFMFSCFNVKPAAATILALSFCFLNFILMSIPYFQDIKYWFLTYHLNFWNLALVQPMPLPRMAESFSILVGFNLSFLIIGCTVFQLRDIKS